MEVLTKRMTYQEFRDLDWTDEDNQLYELLNGEIVARNSPSLAHQRVVGNLYYRFRNFIEANDLGHVFVAPLDVVLDDFNAPQPDVIFVKKEREFVLVNNDEVVVGTPDLVVEVISPSSIHRDRHQKRDIYEQFGVREYWLVDPASKSIEVFVMRENCYRVASFAAGAGVVQSTVLEDFELDLGLVF